MRPRAWIWDFSSTHSLTRALSSEPALQAGPVAALAVAPVGRELASQDVAEAISDLPAGDVVDVVLGGWRGQHDLPGAALRTVQESGDRELVGLTKRVVEPTEDTTIIVASVTVPLHVSVSGQVGKAVAEVEGGPLTKTHSGRCP